MNAMVQSFREMNQMKLVGMAAFAAFVIAIFIFITLRFSTTAMSPLYSGLTTEDSSRIMAALGKMGVQYEMGTGGTEILVPSDQVTKLRLNLAEEGIPASGSVVGYEIFDKSDALGTSNFVLNVNMLRALEGELARTISSFAQVESARVHLVVPKRELFSHEKQEPTASVALKLRGSAELEKNEIAAVRNLVATAVPGLKPSAITIVDSKGTLLAKGVAGEDPNHANMDEANEYRVAFENRMRTRVENMLEETLGVGRVKAQVTAEIDFDRVITNSEKFDPDGQVARSVQGTEEKESSTEPGSNQNVSVANNLPAGQAAQQNAAGAAARTTSKTDEITNFEISKTTENHVKETGTVKKLSVAVLVDGKYEPNSSGDKAYVPRTAEELAQIESLVKTAVGFDEARGDTIKVTNMQFKQGAEENFVESPFDWIKNDLHTIIQTLVMGGVAVLVILLIIRPLVTRLIEAATAAQKLAAEQVEQFAALTAPAGVPRLSSSLSTGEMSGGFGGEVEEESLINLDRVQGRIKSSTYNKISTVVEKHPDEAINVIRQWMMREGS